jgi:glucose/arabinose dehydrogenase
MPKTRRRLLAALGAAASLAGCTGQDGGAGTTTTSEPTPTATGTDPPTSTATPTVVRPAYDVGVDHDIEAWPAYDPEWTAATTAPPAAGTETLVRSLEIPWDLSVAPNGDLFVTERTGRVSRYTAGELRGVARPRDAIDAGVVSPGSRERSWFLDGGEGGTMGVAVHPRYPGVPLVYVYYTAVTSGGAENRLVAMDVSADDPARHVRTLAVTPANRHHNGGRIAFGPEKFLWVTVGDAGDAQAARDPARLNGTVLRLRPDGGAAPGNPGVGDPRVYTYGHRNPQGVTWLPDGRAAITEHGPGPDELSVLVPGGDYGWPAARQPDEYRGSEFRPPAASSGGRTWAPAGCSFVHTGPWAGRVLVGTLALQTLVSFTVTPAGATLPPVGDGVRHDADWLDDRYTVTRHDLTTALGRVRHVAPGPDGVYALTSNRDGRASGEFPTERDDRLVRLRPGGTSKGGK